MSGDVDNVFEALEAMAAAGPEDPPQPQPVVTIAKPGQLDLFGGAL